jgi:hypothetical protein
MITYPDHFVCRWNNDGLDQNVAGPRSQDAATIDVQIKPNIEKCAKETRQGLFSYEGVIVRRCTTQVQVTSGRV